MAAATARVRPGLRNPTRHLPRPPARRLLAIAIVAALAIATSGVVSTLVHLRLPAPTGPHAVGKHVAMFTDPTRAEPGTPTTTDRRQLRLVTWYPAVAGTGEPAAYIEGLSAIREALVESGSVDPLAAAALDAVRDPSRRGATLAAAEARHPVVVFSPGNATNVEFYGSLAVDLASRGYVVVGIDHPFQSGAVAISTGIAVYSGDAPMQDAEAITQGRIDERVADITAVLDGLTTGTMDVGTASDHLDLTRIGLIGHSNGGIAAAEACRDTRLSACVNIDGQLAGGPFSVRPEPATPTKPFLFLTKETTMHPALEKVFEAGGPGTVRVVVPTATHDAFTDGPMFQPRILPLDAAPDHVQTVSRGAIGAFFAHTLLGAPVSVFGDLAAPTDIRVMVYPLGRDRPTVSRPTLRPWASIACSSLAPA